MEVGRDAMMRLWGWIRLVANQLTDRLFRSACRGVWPNSWLSTHAPCQELSLGGIASFDETKRLEVVRTQNGKLEKQFAEAKAGHILQQQLRTRKEWQT